MSQEMLKYSKIIVAMLKVFLTVPKAHFFILVLNFEQTKASVTCTHTGAAGFWDVRGRGGSYRGAAAS